MKDNDSFRLISREASGDWLIAVIIGLIIFWPYTIAHGAEPVSGMTADLGYADCRYTPSPNGQWWQNDQDHSSRLKAGCANFGASFQVNPDWIFGLHWVTLGRADVNALAYACPGDDCSKLVKSTAPECASEFRSNCQYEWNSSVYTRGIAFDGRFRLVELADAVRIEIIAGLYAHRLSSHATVEPMTCHDGPSCPRFATIDQSANRITPKWGAAAQWKWLYLSWEAYENIGAHTPVTANVKGRVEVKTIGLRIPF